MPRTPTRTPSELREAVHALWPGFAGVAAASAAINILMLTGPAFMLQVYDRVLPSRSGATLVGLGLFAMAMFIFLGLFEAMRSRLMLRLSRVFDDRISPRVFDVLARAPEQSGLQAVRDLDTMRTFISGNGLAAFFDLPWMPLYVAICFMFHPTLGFAILGGAILLAALTILGDRLTSRPMRQVAALSADRHQFTEATRRNGILIDALGMRGRMRKIWLDKTTTYLDRHAAGADISSDLGAFSRMLRTALQSAILALGAWLVINQEASGGVMLAATILTIRALAPLEQVIASWRSFVAARQAWPRLDGALADHAIPMAPTPIALPNRRLTVSSVAVAVPGGENPVIAGVSFTLQAGSALGIVGPSGSGKSSLARALVGAWPTMRGVVRLDGATLDRWPSDTIGACLGYMPQDVELFSGSIAQNICRFAENPDRAALLEAAQAADVHDLIMRLPAGYDTQVGDGGLLLAGGQRQRIGLARALYGNPFLVVLDEPNSNLDSAGEQALARAIVGIRRRGGIVVVVAHRSSALAAVDHLMVVNEGHVQHIGRRDDVLAKLGTAPFPQPAVPAPPQQTEVPPKPAAKAPRRTPVRRSTRAAG